MHHHDSRPAQGGFVDESVKGIVADLINVDVELRRVVGLLRRIEDRDASQFLEFGEQRRRIIRDAALGRRHGRPERYTQLG